MKRVEMKKEEEEESEAKIRFFEKRVECIPSLVGAGAGGRS